MYSPKAKLSCIFIALSLQIYAQTIRPEYKFERYSLTEGLSQSSVLSILQDDHGFLWLGTQDGLNRYDGYQFTIFRHRPNDPTSISENHIKAITKDEEGNIWIGTIKGLNFLNQNTGDFRSYLPDSADHQSISDVDITALYIDTNGRFWVGTKSNGLNLMDRKSGKFTHYKHDPDDARSIGKGIIRAIFQDKAQNLWIGTSEGGLCRWDPLSESCVRYYPVEGDPQSISGIDIWTIFQDSNDQLWIGTAKGLNLFDPESEIFSHWFPEPIFPGTISDNKVQVIFEDRKQNFWVGIDGGGLYQFDRATKTFHPFVQEDSYFQSLQEDNLKTIYEDVAGNLWLGTWGGGLSRLELESQRFKLYRENSKDSNSLSYNTVTSFLEDSQGNFWVGTWGGGLNLWDRTTNRFAPFLHDRDDPGSISHNEVLSIYEDSRQNLWIGTDGGGLNLLDRTNWTFQYYLPNDQDSFSLSNEQVCSILEDREQNFWVGTWEGGLNRMDRKTGKFYRYLNDPNDPASLSSDRVHDIFEDASGNLWVGTQGGLDRMEDPSGKFSHFRHDPLDSNSLSNNNIAQIFQTEEGFLWVGTRGGGLNILDLSTGKFKCYLEKDGLPNEVIYSMQEDALGRLWLSTNRGLSCFDPRTRVFLNYDISDGLQDYEFNTAASYRLARTGEMFFGGVNGFNTFFPEQILQDSFMPPVVFSALTRFEVEKARKNYFISNQEALEFSFGEKILSFEFAALSFRRSSKIRYQYQLNGFSEEWYDLGNKREVTFTNLSPGHYTLQVKGTNTDGQWNPVPTTLTIDMLPPWYRSGLAYVLYVCLLALGIYTYYVFQKRRWQLQTQLQLEQAEANRLKELDEVKSHLYTNITHEFRTPLTVISGMTKQMARDPGKWLQQGVEMIERNSQQLLHLINQLLDLRKLESGSVTMNWVQGDVLVYIKYLVESMRSQAQAKDIDLHIESDLEKLVMDHDREKWQQIVSNLLSNALKFTPQGGEVAVRVEREREFAILKVRDSGKGISREDLPRIFDRFYQAEGNHSASKGTGVGLALTKELVSLLNGEIWAHSQPGHGTVFTLKLPITRLASLKEIKIAPDPVQEKVDFSISNEKPSKPKVLIIEDNSDVVQYLLACLNPHYHLSVSRNGQAGIEMALQIIPDLIISDVMMPEKDGFELTAILKKDVRTSHIPIILLTAKADQASRIEGLEKGADAYLSKPFHEEELLIRSKKLLELRQNLQQYYRRFVNGVEEAVSGDLDELEKNEHIFIRKVRKEIEGNFDDPQYSVPQLCQALTMSRSQLHRKLSALTGISANRFIRNIRMEKAKNKIMSTDEPISNIAYDTGFNDPAYFTRVFRSETGMTPSEFRSSHQG